MRAGYLGTWVFGLGCLILATRAFSAVSPAALAMSPTAKPKSTAVPTAAATPAPAVVRKEVLLFCTRQDGHLVLNRCDADGTNRLFFSHAKGSFVPGLLGKAEADDWAPSLSGDGKEIAFYSSFGGSTNLWIMDSDGTHARAVTHSDGPMVRSDTQARFLLRFSPDSKRVAFLNQGNIWVYTPEDDSLGSLTEDGGVTCLAWSPDSKSLAFLRNQSLFVRDLNGLSTRLMVANGLDWPGLQFDKSGQQILYFQNGPRLVRRKDRTIKLVLNTLISPNSMQLSPDGGSLCLLTESPEHQAEVFVSSLDGKATQVTQGGAQGCFFSADGKRLYFLRRGALWTIGVDAKGSRPLIHVPVFCPDNGMAVFNQGS